MNTLGSPPWRVRTERQPVADEERPVAVVEVATAAVTTRARISIPQGNVEKAQTFGLMLYPVIGDSAAESRLEAARVAQLLEDAIGVGLLDGDGESLTRPERIPVYDFEGVPVKGATRAGAAEPYGYLWVEDFPVEPVQDPEDPLRWTVACPLRVSWEQGGRERPPAPLVEYFGGGWAGRGFLSPVDVPNDRVTVGHGPPPAEGVETTFYFDQDSGLLYEKVEG